ncbi:MAG TPA: helix-turn-helix transcriptional regulator [Verrucomicrobiae bacterium]|jgi:transcriptional regulator with XRE-family HTH domain|nr:helix-turn-helix transcriptional regulator [Verrucomicrobiae bacterium]
MQEPNTPFITLGRQLKHVREQSQQSLAEVSGAVEIEERHLERIEAGQERPAEDILLLLISYLGVRDQEAVQLWELANYDSDMPEQFKADGTPQSTTKSVVMLLAVDMRTMYSDGLEITGNQAGFVLNFTQAAGQSRAMPVASIGMSYQQAEAVLHTLQQAMLRAKYLTSTKLLPPPHTEK